MVRRWREPYQAGSIPPHTMWQPVAAMAAMLAEARRGSRYYLAGPLLGKRTARRWLKELGARRVAASKGE